MIELASLLSQLEKEINYEFIRSSGPGGQNVNKVSTGVQLRLDVKNSSTIPIEIKNRLIKQAGRNMTEAGVLVIEAKRYRSQERNRVDARSRLEKILQKAMEIPKQRYPTKPTRASQLRRLEVKRNRGKTKSGRKQVNEKE